MSNCFLGDTTYTYQDWKKFPLKKKIRLIKWEINYRYIIYWYPVLMLPREMKKGFKKKRWDIYWKYWGIRQRRIGYRFFEEPKRWLK